MGQEVRFSDCINVVMSNYDSIIFNPVYSKVLGFYLYCEGEEPIKHITLDNSMITIFYLNDNVKTISNPILFVDVEEERFKRRMKTSLCGSLFRYSKDDAMFYNLDMTKAFPREIIYDKIRKRSI